MTQVLTLRVSPQLAAKAGLIEQDLNASRAKRGKRKFASEDFVARRSS